MQRWSAGVSLGMVFGLAGCGAGNFFNTTATPSPSPVSGGYAGSSFSALVMAGSQAVTGSTLQLYAAGTTGNGSVPVSLLTTAMISGPAGAVSIPAGYGCPTSASLLYLVSRGGTAGGTGSSNANIVLMAALGPCGGVSTGQKAVVNEVTTVAAAYALSPFYANGGQVGATSTNLPGLTNAFKTAATLAEPTSGTSPGSTLPGNVASPAARVNSLANLVNACVVSASSCNALYSATARGSVPSNTLDAIVSLARNPTNNVAALYAQSTSSKAYSPVLAAVPTDWTMFLTVSGGGMNSPSGMGVDSQGNVWVANYFNVASKFMTTGAAVFANGITGFGLNNSYGLAVDLKDNAWIPNEQPYQSAGTIGSVTELAGTGSALSGAGGYSGGGLNYPLSVAIDPNGTVWVVNFGNSHVTLLNSSGVPLSGAAGYTTNLFAFPVVVAVDANHFGWVGNQSSNAVTKVAPDGSSFTNYACCNGASGIAIDQGNNVWVANFYGDSVSLISSAGAIVSTGYMGGGSILRPQGIGVDGAGTVWVANYRQPYLSELAGSTSSSPGAALSPAGGVGGDAGLLEAYALALDASGNIWVTNQGSNTVTKFIGLATPVQTPLSGLPKAP